MEKNFDCHCHVFTRKETVNLRLIIQIIVGLPIEIDKDKKSRAAQPSDENIFERMKSKIETIKRIINFIKTGASSTEDDIYKILEQYYSGNFKITPLMFDLECCFVKDRTDGKIDFLQHQDSLIKEYDKVVDSLKTDLFDFSQEVITHFSKLKMVDRLLHNNGDLLELQKQGSNLLSQLKAVKDEKMADNTIATTLISNYDVQLKDITELKAHYPDDVFPFIAIDTRRNGIIDKYMNEIYAQKTFTGVKLYTPNGYSPTDDDLMKPDGLYAFCVKNNIPITAHNSFGGFATPLESVEIYGDIYDNGVKAVHGMVNLSEAFSPNWVQDRATKFNHPDLWEKVLQTYPTLKLNLAHFGNGNPQWQQKLYSMISNPNYPNLYTDLSCWCSTDDESDSSSIGLKTFYNNFFKNASDYVKSKILYGSDFYLDLLFIDSFTNYLSNFHQVFSVDEFTLIANTNAKKFLFGI